MVPQVVTSSGFWRVHFLPFISINVPGAHPLVHFPSKTLQEMNEMAVHSILGDGPVVNSGILFVDDSTSSPNVLTYNISLVYNESDPTSLVGVSHAVLQAICILLISSPEFP